MGGLPPFQNGPKRFSKVTFDGEKFLNHHIAKLTSNRALLPVLVPEHFVDRRHHCFSRFPRVQILKEDIQRTLYVSW